MPEEIDRAEVWKARYFRAKVRGAVEIVTP